jgi:hypothetical protein
LRLLWRTPRRRIAARPDDCSICIGTVKGDLEPRKALSVESPKSNGLKSRR